MKNLLFIFAMLFALNVYAINATDSMDMQMVVHDQLDALKDGDFTKAFGLLSTGAQSGGDVKEFEKLMKNEYQMLCMNSIQTFGQPFVESGKIVAPVILIDLDGDVWVAAFILTYEEGWKIDGVLIYKDKQKGV